MKEGENRPEKETRVLGPIGMSCCRKDIEKNAGKDKALDKPCDGNVGKEQKIILPIAEINGIEDEGDGDASHDFRDDESRSETQIDVVIDEERKITHAMCIRQFPNLFQEGKGFLF